MTATVSLTTVLGLTVPPQLLGRADEVIEYRSTLLHLLRSAIGTELTKPDMALCPQPAEADRCSLVGIGPVRTGFLLVGAGCRDARIQCKKLLP